VPFFPDPCFQTLFGGLFNAEVAPVQGWTQSCEWANCRGSGRNQRETIGATQGAVGLYVP
jgi:hypothetical protein